MSSKLILYDFCQTFAEGRISRIRNNIRDIQESLSSETKSSAGDKHETGRAMLQLEREKLGQQLAEAEKMVQVLSKVPIKNSSKTIGLGSWVKTTMDMYYLAISAGACEIEGAAVYCISPATPIGQLLIAKSIGDSYIFNGKKIEIVDVE